MAHSTELKCAWRLRNSVKQHWHERYHEDASNRWLRQTMAQLFGAGGSTTLPIE
ncbi:hypothetical protein [Janthinobacterium sp. PSPC2-1]|uniref:hypothetical protein n=1 Tax=unclassified Janthinobacterium TaxID=2610881 RepID=UPI003CF6BF20